MLWITLDNVLFDSFECFLQETYPQTPPIWFSESEEDISISVIIEKLSDTSKKNYNVGDWLLFIIILWKCAVYILCMRGQHRYGAECRLGCIGITWWIQLNHPCAVSMQPFVKSLWPLVIIMCTQFHRSPEIGWLEFKVPFQHKCGYIRDERISGDSSSVPEQVEEEDRWRNQLD